MFYNILLSAFDDNYVISKDYFLSLLTISSNSTSNFNVISICQI